MKQLSETTNELFKGAHMQAVEKLEKIKQLIAVSGNLVNLGRHMLVSHRELYDWVLASTAFLDEGAIKIKFTERLYVLVNGHTSIVLNVFGKRATFENYFIGYSTLESVARKKAAGDATRKKQEDARALRIANTPTKLERYAAKRRRTHPELYTDDAVAGEDYVECPVTGARLLSIHTQYITQTLQMTVEQFESLYPDVNRQSTKYFDCIRNGLAKIDPETGMTIYQKARITAVANMKIPDENGITGYDRLGAKTRATHMANVDEHGRNGYSQIATKAIIKGNKTKVDRGLITDPAHRDAFYRYKSLVLLITSECDREMKSGYVTGLAGTDGAHHLDHIYSIYRGFHDKVSPLLIGHRANLRMLPWKENVSKYSRSDIALEDLCAAADYTVEQSVLEGQLAIDMIRQQLIDGPINNNIILERLYETICARKPAI
jgi:hypothetical protein